MEQKPSIGRIVHYTNLGDKDGKYPPSVQVAIITGVYTDQFPPKELLESCNKPGDSPNCNWVDLKIFYRTGEFFMEKVPFAGDMPNARGHWNWPPKVGV